MQKIIIKNGLNYQRQFSIQFEILQRTLLQGLQVDVDNEPAPEDILCRGDLPLMTNLHSGQMWEWDAIDQRQVIIQTKNDTSFEGNWNPIGEFYSSIFLKLFPSWWLFHCCIYENLEAIVKNGGYPIIKGEFKTYIGLWLLMATCCGWSKARFWDNTPYHPCANLVPFQFLQIMSKT